MSQPSDHDPKLQLSSLVDGEVGHGDVASLCGAWRDDEATRRTWHTYQLIGDALRSDELANDPAGDCDFLAKLRVRLASEPVVLAPSHQEEEAAASSIAGVAVASRSAVAGRASVSSARRWKTPMSVAASVLAVTGVLMVARVSGVFPSTDPQVTAVAQQATPATRNVAQAGVGSGQAFNAAIDSSGLQTVSAQAGGVAIDPSGAALSAVQPQTLVASGKLIRDARLDQYLAAHKQFGGSTALGVPSGFLRSATSEGRDR